MRVLLIKTIFWDYNNFNGTCDFTDVGAVELNIDLPQGEDIFVDEISAITLYQLPTSSATPTASQPSPTRTPTPANCNIPQCMSSQGYYLNVQTNTCIYCPYCQSY